MKALKIDVFNDEAKKIESIIADHIDATNIMTIIYLSRKANHSDIVRWIMEVDHWNVLPEMIKIYYNNNYHIEVTRA